jgi:hypothetical protein
MVHLRRSRCFRVFAYSDGLSESDCGPAITPAIAGTRNSR